MSISKPAGTSVALAALLGTVAAYVGYFSVLSIRERDALYQFDEDLAIYDQIVWNTAHGRFFASTLIQHANNMLGDHFSPVVAIFAPIYWVWPNADVLLVGQSLLLGLMAIPLLLFARSRIGTLAALLLAGAYLIYPALHYVNLFQFHEIVMLPLPLAVALLAVERGSRRLFFVAALVSLTVKEEVAIVVIGVGLLWWLRRRDWRAASATIALGVVVGAITMGIVLPHFSLAGHEYYYVRRYAYLGSGPVQMALTALTSPGVILAHLATPDRLLFLGELVLPLLVLPIVGWEYVLAALPVYGYLLLADSPDQYAIDRHYLSPLLPFLFFGCVLGVERVTRVCRRFRLHLGAHKGRHRDRAAPGDLSPDLSPTRGEELGTGDRCPILGSSSLDGARPMHHSPRGASLPAPKVPPGEGGQRVERDRGRGDPGALKIPTPALSQGERVALAVAALVFSASAAASYWIGPTPLGRKYDAVAFTSTEHTGQIRRLIAEIPASASVSTSRNLLSWFSERTRVYRFPEVGSADYVLLDFRDLRYPAVFGQDGDALGHLLDSPDYRLIDSAGATTLFQRGNPTAWTGPPRSITRFGQVIELLDGQIRESPTNQSVELMLYWRAIAHPTTQYTVFVHVLGADGKVIGQADSWPLDNLYPTDLWRPGRVIPDLHTVHLSQPAPTGRLRAEVGLYDLKTGARLPITARGLPGGSDSVVISSP